MPYKFNGKELDEETGLYYYGARYMQPMASMIKGTVGSQKFPYIGGRTQYFVPSTDNLSKLK